MIKPEANIQDLQNLFVREVLLHLYGGYVPVAFAKGRNLTLNYTPYTFPICAFHNYSSCETSFRCRLPDNATNKFDFVKAIADGALRLVTDKVTSNNSVIWSKQSACLLFEVPLTHPLMLIAGQET